MIVCNAPRVCLVRVAADSRINILKLWPNHSDLDFTDGRQKKDSRIYDH